MALRRGAKRHLLQNVFNVNLPVSRPGSTRVNHNAEFCIFGWHQKNSPYLPTWAFNISENTYNYTSIKNTLYIPQKIKSSSLVSSSVVPILVPYSDPMIRAVEVSFGAQRINFVQFWIGETDQIGGYRALWKEWSQIWHTALPWLPFLEINCIWHSTAV